MLHMRLGTTAIAVVLAAVATVAVAQADRANRTHRDGALQAALDDGGATPPTAAPSTRPGAQDPTSTARSFAGTWVAGPTMTPSAWHHELAKYSTSVLTRQFDGVDPRSVPAHTLTGVPSMTSASRNYAVVTVPTDTGTLLLGLRATDGRWYVDTVDWTRS